MHFRPRVLCGLFTRFVWMFDVVGEDCTRMVGFVGVDCVQM